MPSRDARRDNWRRRSVSTGRWLFAPRALGVSINPGVPLDKHGQAGRGHRRVREAIRTRPKDYASPQQPRQRPARQEGQLDGAIAEYREAIDLDPKLRRGPQQPRQRPAPRRTVWTRPSPSTARPSTRPKYAEAHYNLGIALRDKGRPGRGHRRVPRGPPTQEGLRPRPTAISASPCATRGSSPKR